jgi:outer membrane lipoprotein carrier protein
LKTWFGNLLLTAAVMAGWQTFGAGPVGLTAQETRALALVEEAGARYREIGGFCAEFRQTLEVPLLGETNESHGSLCQEKPNLFAMRFTQPQGDLLVADGEFFWVYYPSSDPRQVLRFEMEGQPGGVDFHREFLDSPEEKYRMEYLGEESVSGVLTQKIALDPLGPAAFTEAAIWLDSSRSLILQARIEMENGSVRTVSLSDIRLDPPGDPTRFSFVPPEGAQVIRRN